MNLFTASFVLALLSICTTACHTTAQKKKDEKKEYAVAGSLNSVKYQFITDAIKSPVQMVAAPDSTHRLFIGDLSGRIFIMQNGKVLPKPFIDISSKLEQKDTTPEMRAIFSIAFHPQFAVNKKFYICYNAPAGNAANKCKLQVSEFRVSDDDLDRADLSSERKVFAVEGKTIGVDDCQITFGPDGYMYIAVGDNGTPLAQREAQQLNSYLGKLLRIDVNQTPYGIPSDNPFVAKKNAKPEIWSYGLRRLWRFSFDLQTHQLIGADVGDKMQEEIDIIQKGGNYGWPVVEGDSLAVKNTTVDTTDFIAPVSTYTHKEGICIIGGHIYHGSSVPLLKDKYVFADYNGHMFTLTKSASGKWVRQSLKPLNAPADPLIIFSIDKDEHNELYLLGVLNTNAGSKGVIYKLAHG